MRVSWSKTRLTGSDLANNGAMRVSDSTGWLRKKLVLEGVVVGQLASICELILTEATH